MQYLYMKTVASKVAANLITFSRLRIETVILRSVGDWPVLNSSAWIGRSLVRKYNLP